MPVFIQEPNDRLSHICLLPLDSTAPMDLHASFLATYGQAQGRGLADWHAIEWARENRLKKM
jgi:hypothetical protein